MASRTGNGHIPPPLLTQYKKYYLEFFLEKQFRVIALWNSFQVGDQI